MIEFISLILGLLGIIGGAYIIKGIIVICRRIKSFGEPRRLGEKLHRLGVREVWPERKNASIIVDALFEKRNGGDNIQKVQMMGQSLAWLKDRGDETLKKLLNKGCRFKFLLLDPDSELMDMRTRQENPDLKNECKGFIKWIKQIFSKYEGQMEIRVHKITPTMGMTIINENTLYVSPYAMTRRTHVMPVLMIIRSGSLFEKFSGEFENVWKTARTVFPICG